MPLSCLDVVRGYALASVGPILGTGLLPERSLALRALLKLPEQGSATPEPRMVVRTASDVAVGGFAQGLLAILAHTRHYVHALIPGCLTVIGRDETLLGTLRRLAR